MMRFIPTRSAIVALVTAVFAALFAWARHDARQDLKQELKQEDLNHAKDISDRVSDDRADPDRVQPYSDAGYRD